MGREGKERGGEGNGGEGRRRRGYPLTAIPGSAPDCENKSLG